MDERVRAMVFELAEGDAQHLLEGLQVGVVVVDGRSRFRETTQASAHTIGRQVLDDAVVLVQPGVLPDERDHQVAHGAEARLHRPDTRVRPPWPLATAAQRAATSPGSTSP